MNTGVNPRPNICDNETLLHSNPQGTAWVAKDGMTMASKGKEGDYRRISEAAWKEFCDMYPGSGPAIHVKFYEVNNYHSFRLKL